MKLITTLALSLMGISSFAQTVQIGFESGVLSNSLDKGLQSRYYADPREVPHWKVNHLNASLFGRLQTNTHFAFELQASYYQDHYASASESANSASIYYQQMANQANGSYVPTHTTTYNAKLDCNPITFTLTVQYCLNSQYAITHNKVFKHYVGISYGFLTDIEYYSIKIHDFTAGTYGERNSTHYPTSNLLGIQYLATYKIRHHVVLSLNLSLQKNTAALFHHTDADWQEYFSPRTYNTYLLIAPTYYFNCLAGIAYKF